MTSMTLVMLMASKKFSPELEFRSPQFQPRQARSWLSLQEQETTLPQRVVPPVDSYSMFSARERVASRLA
jgi:hypothetical protein